MTTAVLNVDPIRCTGHGLCAELLPEFIQLDEWEYPIVAHRDVERDAMRNARRAVSACPTLALRLQRPAVFARASRG